MSYRSLLLAATLSAVLVPGAALSRDQWTAEQAIEWYDAQPWIVGANYTPSSAVNQIEAWHPDTFDPATIDKELGYASDIGMNTMRVFLHNLMWENDAEGFKERIDQFLDISAKHDIRILFVLFDSDWDPNPVYGKQKSPVPGVHNSRWVQGPGGARLKDASQYDKLQGYVEDIVGTFADDTRVIGWDLWNEPNSPGGGNYAETADKSEYVALLLPQVYEWARGADPIQPLTSGLWIGPDWDHEDKRDEIERIQLNQSDINSFHDYGWPEVFEARVQQLASYGRPMIATEYMARGSGSTFDGTLPIGKKHNVGMLNWGLVDGKTQTRFPWDSWWSPYSEHEPIIWFHEIFHADGTPYRQAEVDLIKRLSAAPKGVVPIAEE